MSFSYYKTRRVRFLFVIYWILLAYIISALVWWYIALNRQNHQMAEYETIQLKKDYPEYLNEIEKIKSVEKAKTAQYTGEGSVFFLLIIAGAAFIYSAVRRQFKASEQQNNFMMGITHELKTPIAVTKLNLETLQKRKLEDSQQQRLIQNTIQEANRLNSLCNNMLLASQIEAGGYSITKEEVNFSDVVRNCVHDFTIRFPQRQLQDNIANEIYIEGDFLLLQMAINNLIDNAIKYSPKETAIIISLYLEGKQIKLSVKDEGKGIEDSEKKKVFDKFYRVGNTATKGAKGTGLGLYLTKKIAQQHKANISVTDNNPTGSNFTISFKNEGSRP